MTDNARFLIWSNEHTAWWAPGQWGYTPWIEEAGRYTETEARAIIDQANYPWNQNVVRHRDKPCNETMVLAPEAIDAELPGQGIVRVEHDDMNRTSLGDGNYVARHGRSCPKCFAYGHNQRRDEPTRFDINAAYQAMACTACGATWWDRYRLMGYTDLDSNCGEAD